MVVKARELILWGPQAIPATQWWWKGQIDSIAWCLQVRVPAIVELNKYPHQRPCQLQKWCCSLGNFMLARSNIWKSEERTSKAEAEWVCQSCRYLGNSSDFPTGSRLLTLHSLRTVCVALTPSNTFQGATFESHEGVPAEPKHVEMNKKTRWKYWNVFKSDGRLCMKVIFLSQVDSALVSL